MFPNGSILDIIIYEYSLTFCTMYQNGSTLDTIIYDYSLTFCCMFQNVCVY